MNIRYAERTADLNGTATREIFKLLSRPEIISFAGGLPASDLLPEKEVAEITEALLSGKDAKRILQYGTSEGFADFRETLVDYVKQVGIDGIDTDNTLVISGGQQGIDLMCKALLDKGDTVLVEQPTYLAVLQILKSYEAKAVGVNANADGLDTDDLEKKIIAHKPKMLYVVPTFSNPTGKTYSRANREKIAEITAKYGVIVLEDDPYGKLRFSGESVNSLKSFAAEDNTVYITSFSKLVSPGLRVGVAVGGKEIIRKLTICKQGTDLHTSNLSQLIVKRFVEEYLGETVKRSIPVYRKRRDAMTAALDRYMPFFDRTDPEGGLFVFGSLPASLNAEKLLPKAIEHNVAYIQGSVFFADGGGENTVRLNYSNASAEQIEQGIRALGSLFASYLT